MSIKSEYPPLTWARIKQLAQAGHDDFEPPINAPRARELVESAREHFEHTSWVAPPDDATATLARVREALEKTNPTEPLRAMIESALGITRGKVISLGRAHCPGCDGGCNACQPEAPATPEPWHVAEQKTLLAALTWHRRDTKANADALHYWCQKAIEARPLCSQPNAPKGPAAEADPFALEFENMDLEESVAHLERKLEAANARADAAEEKTERLEGQYYRTVEMYATIEKERDQLAQKLEEAERGARLTAQACDQARDERDQLAARVTELAELNETAFARGMSQVYVCTPEERKVLEAWKLLTERELDRLSSDESIRLVDVAIAEQDNRAAKAKRGGA